MSQQRSKGGKSEQTFPKEILMSAFDNRAMLMAKRVTDDETLQQILIAHYGYETKGDVEDLKKGVALRPQMEDGVPFYRVGRNASHSFYLGYKDGQLYHGAWGPEYVGPEDGCDCMDRAHEVYEAWKYTQVNRDEVCLYDCEEAAEIDYECESKHWPVTWWQQKTDSFGYCGHW